MKRFVLALFVALVSTAFAADILTGAGDATFYYDINGGGTCGPANNINSFPETGGYPMCEGTNPNPKVLSAYNTNNIVAIPNQILGPNLAQYCGKQVIVTIDGVKRDDLNLFVWDGCEACNANDGLDFSSTVFGELFGADRCAQGRISGEMSWEITDTQVLSWDAADGGSSNDMPPPDNSTGQTAPTTQAAVTNGGGNNEWNNEENWGEQNEEEFAWGEGEWA